MPSRPIFWIVAGPNGYGKSTLIRLGSLSPWLGEGVQALSPDDIVLTLREAKPHLSEADLLRQAQEASDELVRQSIERRQTVLVETVLSSDKFQPLVTKAIDNGFMFGLAFVTLRSPSLNVARVSARVREGGHDVPEDRILARRARSHAALTWFARRAHVGAIFDNTEQPASLLAEKRLDEPNWRILQPGLLQTLGIDPGF